MQQQCALVFLQYKVLVLLDVTPEHPAALDTYRQLNYHYPLTKTTLRTKVAIGATKSRRTFSHCSACLLRSSSVSGSNGREGGGRGGIDGCCCCCCCCCSGAAVVSSSPVWIGADEAEGVSVSRRVLSNNDPDKNNTRTCIQLEMITDFLLWNAPQRVVEFRADLFPKMLTHLRVPHRPQLRDNVCCDGCRSLRRWRSARKRHRWRRGRWQRRNDDEALLRHR